MPTNLEGLSVLQKSLTSKRSKFRQNKLQIILVILSILSSLASSVLVILLLTFDYTGFASASKSSTNKIIVNKNCPDNYLKSKNLINLAKIKIAFIFLCIGCLITIAIFTIASLWTLKMLKMHKQAKKRAVLKIRKNVQILNLMASVCICLIVAIFGIYLTFGVEASPMVENQLCRLEIVNLQIIIITSLLGFNLAVLLGIWKILLAANNKIVKENKNTLLTNQREANKKEKKFKPPQQQMPKFKEPMPKSRLQKSKIKKQKYKQRKSKLRQRMEIDLGRLTSKDEQTNRRMMTDSGIDRDRTSQKDDEHGSEMQKSNPLLPQISKMNEKISMQADNLNFNMETMQELHYKSNQFENRRQRFDSNQRKSQSGSKNSNRKSKSHLPPKPSKRRAKRKASILSVKVRSKGQMPQVQNDMRSENGEKLDHDEIYD